MPFDALVTKVRKGHPDFPAVVCRYRGKHMPALRIDLAPVALGRCRTVVEEQKTVVRSDHKAADAGVAEQPPGGSQLLHNVLENRRASDLAAERGSYSTFKGSKWDRGILPLDTLKLLDEERGIDVEVPRGAKLDWDPLRDKIAKQGMRNSNVLAIAPTATISNIMGTTPCVEPTYKNLFVKSNLSGDFIVLNSYLVREIAYPTKSLVY